MIGKKINQLATELAPVSTDLTIIGDPVSGVSKKITLAQLGAIFSGAVSFYNDFASFPATGDINVIYCAKDTKKLYLWSGSAYVEVFPSQALLDTYQLRSEKGNANGYASLDSSGKVPISQLPSSIMEYKGTWSAATNTPTLANGTGDTGDVYICNSPGSVNFGAGAITFAIGDYVIYSGTIWQRSSGAVGTVTSVAATITGDAIGITGSPVTTSGTLAFAFGGNSTQYINGAGNLITFPSIISQAQNLVTEVYNNTGATLTKGTIVYINGGQGNLPTVTKALATGDSTSAQTYGVVQTDITNMNNGYVVVAGRLTDLDTQAYSNGTQLYLSATTAGTWTPTKQYAPNHLVYVGIVVRSHPTQGVVEIKIQNGYELDELHNVAAQSPDNNDILQYKTATSLWTKVAGTTTNIAEGTNLYYTDARSRAALSFTAGSGAYNSTTGVITIPTNTNQLTNGAAFITLASLSAGAGISYNNTTGVIASTITQYTDAMARASISGGTGISYNSTTGVITNTITQYTDALARAAISLTTTGTSGAATYNNTTGVLNIPQYQTALTNPVTGTGTTNYLPKFTGASTIGNSSIVDNTLNVTIAKGNAANDVGLQIQQTSNFTAAYINITANNDGGAIYNAIRSNTNGGTTHWQIDGGAAVSNLVIRTGGTERLRINASGNLGLGVTPSAWSTSFGIKVIDVGSKGTFYASDNDANISFNQYFDGTNAVYKTTGTASRFALVGNEFQWRTAPSGTAGNAISFTQAMTLNSSGNLSIGNTNDTYKLDVSGTGRFTGAVGTPVTLTIASGNSNCDITMQSANSSSVSRIRNGTNDLQFHTNGTLALTLASNQAATFSSSVTAGAFITNAASGTAGQEGLRIINDNGYIGFFNGANSTRSGYLQGNTTDVTLTTSPSTPLILGTANTERMRITSGGAVQITQTIQTGAPTNGTAQPWRLGDARSGSISTNSYIIVSVNGTTYSIPALNGLP